MIELRIVENELGMKPDIQYRHHMLRVDANGALCPPPYEYVWSEWKTAEWVKAETLDELAQ